MKDGAIIMSGKRERKQTEHIRARSLLLPQRQADALVHKESQKRKAEEEDSDRMTTKQKMESQKRSDQEDANQSPVVGKQGRCGPRCRKDEQQAEDVCVGKNCAQARNSHAGMGVQGEGKQESEDREVKKDEQGDTKSPVLVAGNTMLKTCGRKLQNDHGPISPDLNEDDSYSPATAEIAQQCLSSPGAAGSSFHHFSSPRSGLVSPASMSTHREASEASPGSQGARTPLSVIPDSQTSSVTKAHEIMFQQQETCAPRKNLTKSMEQASQQKQAMGWVSASLFACCFLSSWCLVQGESPPASLCSVFLQKKPTKRACAV